jgi:signal transduction histidine kinase
MTVAGLFSGIIYRIQIDEVNRLARAQRILAERRIRELPLPFSMLINWDDELIKESRKRIVASLGIINAGILVGSAAVAYFVAGKTLAPIKIMMDEQNRFVSDASHELRTPLTAIKTSTEVLLRNKEATLKDTKKLLMENVSEVDRLQSLTDHLLQLSRYKILDIGTKMQGVAMDEVIRESVKLVQTMAAEKNIKIKSFTKATKVLGVHSSLRELVVILLDNAIKYSPSGSVVEINTETNGFNIIDHGIGIAAVDMPHIFDRFFRSDKARGKGDAGGYGLGLSIAKRIVETHNGQLKVMSKKNIGTKFVVRLQKLT